MAEPPMVEGAYESHHLLCPAHGRTVATGDGTASCGCTPHVLWEVCSHGEGEWTEPTDNIGIGRRYDAP